MNSTSSLWELVAKASKLGFWCWHIQSNEIDWSDNIEEVLSCSRNDLADRFETFRTMIYFADRNHVLQAIQKSIDNRTDHQIDYRIVLPNGDVRWIEGHGKVILSESGEARQLLGTMRDLTSAVGKKSEGIKGETQRRASKENALLAATVANAPVGVSISDPNQEDDPIVFVNPTFLAMTGYRQEDFVGRNCRFLQGAETNPETVAQIRRALRKKEPITVEILNYRKDGSTFWNLLTITPLFDESGKHTHFIGMQTDITERKKSEELTRRAKEAAEAANQAKSDFIANMSHELRTPLNGILGYAQMLKHDPHLTARQKQGVETIYHSGTHLLSLVDNILNFSSLDAGQEKLDLTHFHLATMLDDLVKTARMKAEQKRISFIYEKDDRLPSGIRGDKPHLEQILSNLLDNAIKFTKKGQVILKVTVLEVDQSAEQIRLRFEVIDTGVGIREELLAKIFQPFEQLGTLIERADGTGLGLTITRQLVQLMGGEIKVESRVGEGSRFCFDLTFQIAKEDEIDSELHNQKQIADKTNKVVSAEQAHSENLVTMQLIPPPQAELEVLYELAILGKMSAIRQQMDDIEQLNAKYAPFANKVRKLARGFEDDEIVALVERYLGPST